jgi:hypothetical protein
LEAWIAAAPTNPEEIREAEEDLRTCVKTLLGWQ